uniref:tRNA-guanine(15) transglycosylase-like domain-containing protein n=1 Tax=Meloidogyne incognita TaxID=6306 RepID=A0A914MLR4_MELIC
MFGNYKSFRNPSISFIGRVGQINTKQECSPSTSNYLCSTPNTMLYTRGGHIPHLTWDLFDNHIAAYVEHKRLLIQISLQNIFDSLEVIKLSGGIKNFYRFESEHFLHLSLLDPLSARDVVSNRFIHFWSRGGRKKMDMEQFKNAIETTIPDSFQAPFDFDTPIDCCNKKLQKCLKRSRSFFETLKINSEDNNCFDKRTVFSIGGGSSIFHRKIFVKELLLQLCPDDIEVINLDLFLWSKVGKKKEENFGKEFLRQLIAETLSYLPQNNLRIVEGPFDPSQVLFLFKQGVDLFDSSYPTFLAEKGFAFELLEGFPLDDNNEQFSLIDLNEKKYLNEHKTLFPNCECYTCKLGNGYTRAYIGHLLLCKEMFGYTLLMLHNIYEWLRMFSLLKMSIVKNLENK